MSPSLEHSMSNDDDLQDFKPLDPGRVHPLDPIEVRWWCRELRCSEDELRRAIERVGVHVAEIRPELAGMRGTAAPSNSAGSST
jgi:hypothetical protein